MRGKHVTVIFIAVLLRITPACAGKTMCPPMWRAEETDHPRVCGENDPFGFSMTLAIGSPPRVRGKHSRTTGKCLPSRITPACAGKTSLLQARNFAKADHPRVCGENSGLTTPALTLRGSPPRVRGKPTCRRMSNTSARITPACAGKTLRKWRISVVDPSPQPRSSLTSRRAGASIGSQRAPCAAPV